MNVPLDPRIVEDSYPFQAHLGFKLTAWSENRSVFVMEIADFHQNRHGIPHGGVYASLLDTCMGFAGCWTGDPDRRVMAMTLSLTTNFLSRPTGTRLIAEGRRVGGGSSTYFAEGEIRDETGAIMANATGVFRYRKSR